MNTLNGYNNRKGAGLMIGVIGSIWGIAGVSCLLCFAVWRLTPIAISIFSAPLLPHHWGALLASLLFFAYFEGYKGFQKSFSPRAAARAKYIYTNPRFLNSLLAPLFCMGFFGTVPRRQISSILLTTVIICFIVGIRMLSQPWRGLVDAGVVIGLSWGVISLWIFFFKAVTTQDFKTSPEVPGEN